MSMDVFGGAARPGFDSTAHTTGGMPHLMQYLWDQYREFLRHQIERKTLEGKRTIPLEEALRRAPATSFVAFAADFLGEQRIQELFPLDANYGVRLANGDYVAICPGTDIQGTMQESTSIDVMEGKSRPDQRTGNMNFGMPGG